ncbi:BON domain-containing protein [Actinokineospora sp. HUAS TT18]|uniref:BON domain-containing protein n=1 Tax=Actinokineospora sp. HUAS TT18 TaxID=3447451 RepID=UPI003F51B38F
MTVRDRIDSVPAPRTESDPVDLGAVVRRALAEVPLVDTSQVRAGIDGDVVLLVGRVEWSSQARAVGEWIRRVPGVREVRDRIGYVYNDVDDRRIRGIGLFG